MNMLPRRPRQALRLIEVRYTVEVPLQKKKPVTNVAASPYEQSTLLDEANNCPPTFLERLGRGRFYFFDCYLTSGASWKGPIGSENLRLHSANVWSGKQVFCSQPERLQQTDGLTRTYTLKNEERQEDLYFALPEKRRR